jgi:hypothetical protein
MNPQEINRRIAIACGWKLLPNSFPPNSRLWEHPSGKRAYEPDDLPNYHGDLNAMHEALGSIDSYEQAERYVDELDDVVFREWKELEEHECPPIAFATRKATAAQRAEAFLRTIGKWEEAK